MACISILLTGRVGALTYRYVSDVELVGRSNVIVSASVVSRAGDLCRLSTTETLFGATPKEFQARIPVGNFDGLQKIFFLENDGCDLALLKDLPPAKGRIQEVSSMERFRTLAAMKAKPSDYARNPQYAQSAEFLEMLGWAFHGKEAVDGMTKEIAIEHLNKSLSVADHTAVAPALDSLKSLGSRDSTAVLPLIERTDAGVRERALMFLVWAADSNAMNPLCKALDEVKPGEKNSDAHLISLALYAIGDPRAVPALEQAVKRGVAGASFALGGLGDVGSFEVLQEALVRVDSMNVSATSITQALGNIVRRSNKPLEKWMDENGWSRTEGVRHKKEWLDWWSKNKADFQIVQAPKALPGIIK